MEIDSDEVKSWNKGADPFSDLRHVAGVDISFDKEHPTHACAMLAILSFPDLKVCHSYFFFMVYLGCQFTRKSPMVLRLRGSLGLTS